MVTKRISGVLSDVEMCSLRVISLKIFFANFFLKLNFMYLNSVLGNPL